MTNKRPQQRRAISMAGLGVMGRNLVLNMADHSCAVAGYDKGVIVYPENWTGG
jgi:6-phosphogluconate dehydrogenase